MQGLTFNVVSPSPVSEQDFSLASRREFDVVNPDNAPLTFYAAINSRNEVIGSVQVNPYDRNQTAQLVGAWIHAGYAVERLGFKKLSQRLAKQQKAADEAAALAEQAALPDTTTTSPVETLPAASQTEVPVNKADEPEQSKPEVQAPKVEQADPFL